VHAADPAILDMSLRDRRKHLVDNFAVVLLERRGVDPSVDNRLVGFHQRKCSYRIADAPLAR
jgi:hypothetical protein